MSREETDAEVQVRLAHERRCRELADELKEKLGPSMAFILLTATRGGSDDGFQSTSYVATMERESALRLLTEFIDSQWQSGAVTEPTHRTCTFIREAVADIREKDRSKILTSIRHHVRALIEATAPIERANAALLLACEALAIFDVESRKAQPQRGN